MANITKNKKINKTINITVFVCEVVGVLILAVVKGPQMGIAAKVAAVGIAFDAIVRGWELVKLIYRD